MRTIAMLPACSVFVTQPFLVSRITASPEVIAPYSSALPLDWILDPNKGSSFADRVLARLIQAEAHESDPWYRDDCRQAFIVLNHVWYHEIDCGPDRHQSCDCHCAECDPRGGYADGRACIDGESAEPEGEAA